METFEVAPAAIVRMAGWPCERLDELQEPELAELANGPEDAETRDAYERAYREAVERQRQRLWAATVRDAAFRCAVALASPSLAHELVKVGLEPSACRNKRARHFETSMYRYLARAIGRTDPCGLWAGVGVATFGRAPMSSFVRRRASVRIDPDLGPFRAMFRALCEREPYRSLGRFRVNPSLRSDEHGRWTCGRKQLDGSVEWLELPDSPIWDAVRHLQLDPRGRSLWQIEHEVGVGLGDPSLARPVADLLRSEGLLVGGLVFPTQYETPRQALLQAEAHLRDDDREHWRAARCRIAPVCHALGERIASLLSDDCGPGAGAEDVLAVNDAVRSATIDLLAALDVVGIEIPTAMLRCDLLIPVAIELGRDDANEIRSWLDDWACTQAREGGLLRYPRRAAAVLEGRPEVRVMQAPAEASTATSVCATNHAAGPPLGALVARPGSHGLTDPWIRGLSDAPTATHARHAALLATVGDPLFEWFRRAFRELQASSGIEAVDLVDDGVISPNVLARPAYVERWIDPWRAGGIELDADAVLRLGPSESAPVLELGGRWFGAFSFTAANVGTRDIVVQRLLATSFVATAGSTSTPGSRARRCTAGGRPVVPAQTRLGEDARLAIVGVRGAERFRRWSRMARHHAWPDHVRVKCGDHPPLLVPTHSPLAIEAAFEGITGDGEVLVEEVLDAGWIPGERGTHRAELVVPVHRRDHAWRRSDTEDLPDAAVR